ncbi:MotE family protein, partial [Helicobacter ailurogastricus]|uniref:MotE family protein n=1 Tax=Helicobacter ailurogastricus TaxID=1578720 RepID=UPI0006B48D72
MRRLALCAVFVGLLLGDTDQISSNGANPPKPFPSLSTPKGANPSSQQFLQCNAIFESRKAELSNQLQLLQERALTLQNLQEQTQSLLDQRNAKVAEREKALDTRLKEFEAKEKAFKDLQAQKEKELKKLVAQNEELLKEIKEASSSKVATTYAKMKDSKAAPILQDMPIDQAATILSKLEAKDMGKILAKMDPQKAANLTEMLQKGPPFKAPPPPPPPPLYP